MSLVSADISSSWEPFPFVLTACRFPILFFIICIVLLAFVKLNSCSSYIEAWLTLLPMMVVMTVVSLVAAYIFEPKVSICQVATACSSPLQSSCLTAAV